jgi:putative acetyltransferase
MNLVFSVLREYGLEPDPEGIDEDLKDIEQSYSARGGEMFVLEDGDGAIVGSYGLYPVSDAACELRKMYLRAEHRGQGLGKRVLEDAITRARQMGFREIVLETASVLAEAIALYKSYGFVEYTPKHLCHRCDQAYRLVLG